MKTTIETQTWAISVVAVVLAVVLPTLIEFVVTAAPVASTVA